MRSPALTPFMSWGALRLSLSRPLEEEDVRRAGEALHHGTEIPGGARGGAGPLEVVEVARQFGVSRQSVHDWIARYEQVVWPR
jgi:hypothetical protein